MKTILGLNAFDADKEMADTDLRARLEQRARLFGAASVLFYERPLQFVRAAGCWLYDNAGNAFLDAYNNVPSVGHSHPQVVAAASAQLASINVHSRYLHPSITNYAEALLATLPASLSNIAFTCTGSESNDLAVRMAESITGGRGVIVTAAAYHGNTAALTALSPSAFTGAELPPHVRAIPAPDSFRTPTADLAQRFAAHVAAAIDDLQRHGIKFSALLLDSIFSSDGIFADPPGCLQAAVDVAHRAGGVLIADEVQAGFGRTGTAMWGFERHGIAPDIVTLGKPIGNGYPLGAAITRPEILDTFCKEVGYFNTFAASPVAGAVGLAVLDALRQDDLLANASRVGAQLQRGLRALGANHPAIGDVRGAGLYIGVELVAPGTQTPDARLANAVINGLRERRVLIGAAGRFGNVLKLRPPLCFSNAHAQQLIAALDATLAEQSARA